MGRFTSRKKKLIAYAIIVSLQMQAVVPCYTAFAAISTTGADALGAAKAV